MKILFLTPNYKNYNISKYQLNTLKYLKKKSHVIVWGPGCDGFDFKKSFEEILEDYKITDKDAVCVGHGWLSDLPLNNEFEITGSPYNWMDDNHLLDLKSLEYISKYDFKIFKGRKIFFLNKEYVSLNEKLNFAKENKFDLILSLNPNYKDYIKRSNLNIKFWPTAVDHEVFKNKDYLNTLKSYDIFFSGLIQNFSTNSTGNSLRTLIMKKFYYTFDRVKIFKKKKYSKFDIFWNSFTSRRYYDILLKILKRYEYLDEIAYMNKLKSSKIAINTLSPSDIIGPRFFEAMILGTVNLCENDEKYDEAFNRKEHVVTFQKDLSDFDEKIKFSLSDSQEIEYVRSTAYNHALDNHTYLKRTNDLLKWINEI